MKSTFSFLEYLERENQKLTFVELISEGFDGIFPDKNPHKKHNENFGCLLRNG